MWIYKKPSEPYLTPDEKKQVTALFEAILPGSDTNPGATDAAAAEYLDLLLTMDESEYYEIGKWKVLYRDGLEMLSKQSNSKYGRPLDELKRDEITTLLTELSNGTSQGFPNSDWQKNFFSILRGHCIEGCFSDPRWGGNQKGAIWDWYGYPNGPSRPWNPKTEA
jgi:hypothetical protein